MKLPNLRRNAMSFIVSALYHFATLENYTCLQAPLLRTMKAHGVKGTLLLAREGINGTIAGTREGIDAVLAFIRSDDRLKNVITKESVHSTIPFYRSKVKLKKEIVTMGVADIDPTRHAGTYVSPKDWNELISDPDTIVVDTRNQYEVAIGTFKGAENPKTETFREFPDYVKEQLAHAKHKKIAMFCTGGIRCEKSTSYLKQQGFSEVYHLEGGILKYLEEIPEQESLWEGECFVFDSRVAVKHGLEKGQYDQCFACRMPITEVEKNDPTYQKGISCPHCYGKQSNKQLTSHAERQKQIALAREKGEPHLGGEMAGLIAQRRITKRLRKMSCS